MTCWSFITRIEFHVSSCMWRHTSFLGWNIHSWVQQAWYQLLRGCWLEFWRCVWEKKHPVINNLLLTRNTSHIRLHQTLPAGFFSSALNSSAPRLEKLSSSKGFHAGCVGVLEALPDTGTAAPALLWSCPASPALGWTGWAVLAWDGSDLQVKRKYTKYHR